MHPDYKIDEALKELTYPENIGENGFILEPNELILAWTVEYIELPINSRVAARVEGKEFLRQAWNRHTYDRPNYSRWV